MGDQDYRGTSLIRNSPPPQDHHRTLGVESYCRVMEGGVSHERGTPVLVGVTVDKMFLRVRNI